MLTVFHYILDRKEGRLGNKSVFLTNTENASFPKVLNSSFWSNTVKILEIMFVDIHKIWLYRLYKCLT